MSRLPSKLVMLILIMGCAPSGFTTDQGQDETAIRRVEADLQDAWNRHDMEAWANLFSEHADFVNVVGWWWKGRAQIEKKSTDAHASVFKESTLTVNDVDIKFLTPQIALAHVRWSLVGHKNPDGTPGQPRKGIFTQVLQKQTGKWLIVAAQNTDSIPEEPFPATPLNVLVRTERFYWGFLIAWNCTKNPTASLPPREPRGEYKSVNLWSLTGDDVVYDYADLAYERTEPNC